MYILLNVSLGRIHKKQLIYKNELKYYCTFYLYRNWINTFVENV